MYVQLKKSNDTKYVYLVESYRKDDGSIGHRTLEKLGRLDDLLKNDPQALEKLKAEVKEKSAMIRGAINKAQLNKVKTIANHSQIKGYEQGLPQINYAYRIFDHIWSDILKLEYRLDYLQTKYYSDIEFSLSEVLLSHTVIEILSLDSENDDLKYGDDLGFLGINYTNEQLTEYTQNAQNLLNEESLRLLRFIVKNLSSEYGLDFLNSGTSQLTLHFDKEFLDKLDIKSSEVTISADEIVHKKVSRFKQIFSYLRIIMMKLIRFRVQEKFGEDYEFSDLKKAMREAIILVDYPLNSDGRFMYIKRNNGRTAEIMNKIMSAFDMSPLLNIEDKIELGHRLHLKLRHDEQIIPEYMFNKINH